jgi:signal transduction histidine kinase
MFIARKIIELHHGTIELIPSSKKNITTLYEIVLPRLK